MTAKRSDLDAILESIASAPQGTSVGEIPKLADRALQLRRRIAIQVRLVVVSHRQLDGTG